MCSDHPLFQTLPWWLSSLSLIWETFFVTVPIPQTVGCHKGLLCHSCTMVRTGTSGFRATQVFLS